MMPCAEFELFIMMRLNKKSKPSLFTPKWIIITLAFLSVFIIEFFLKTWCGMQCIRIGYEITSAINKQQNLINMEKNLKIELVHLKSPEVLEKVATERFGLTIPKPDQIVVIQ